MNDKLHNLVAYTLDRTNEPSTLRGGIVIFSTVAGLTLAPDKVDAIALGAVILSQVLKCVLPDAWTKPQ